MANNVKKGIDVSYAQGNIDFSKINKNEVQFAIIRSSFGWESNQKDNQFERNYSNFKKLGIPVGAYHYSYAQSAADAVKEAKYCIECIKGKTFELPIFFDLEDPSIIKCGKRVCTDIVKAFCDYMKKAGYKTGVYINPNWLNNYVYRNEIVGKYTLWLAHWGVTSPAIECDVWQYNVGSRKKIDGINGEIDLDYIRNVNVITNSNKKNTNIATDKTQGMSGSVKTVDDKTKFLNQARSYIGKNGNYVCNTKLGLGKIVDWCAYSVSAIMKDCGFIGKYQTKIYGYASDNAREDNGKYGTWFKKGTKSPLPGDLIMFRYSSFTNPLDKYSASHVGIVEKVSGNTITTLEGNVDGYGDDWAKTSTFKRKTRYLNDENVYSFFRFNWKTPSGSNTNLNTNTNNKTNNSNNNSPKKNNDAIDVVYQVYADGRWLPEVKNLEDYAGLENKSIQGIYMKPSKGHIKYRVKLVGQDKYLKWVVDKEDYAGIIGKDIDCIQARFYGYSNYYVIEYRVSTNSSNNYLEWVRDFNLGNDDGYAGIKGRSIDKLQVRIVKTNINK